MSRQSLASNLVNFLGTRGATALVPYLKDMSSYGRVQTIENVRKRLVTEGFDLALNGQQRQDPPTRPKLDGAAEAQLIAMRLGKPPAGYGHWTLQLLADELVALEVVESISHETVRKTLKKMA